MAELGKHSHIKQNKTKKKEKKQKTTEEKTNTKTQPFTH